MLLSANQTFPLDTGLGPLCLLPWGMFLPPEPRLPLDGGLECSGWGSQFRNTLSKDVNPWLVAGGVVRAGNGGDVSRSIWVLFI